MGGKLKGEDVPFLVAGSDRYPVLQPVVGRMEDVVIRKTSVVVSSDEASTIFEIHFRYNRTFDTNSAVKAIWNGIEWRGDVVVIQGGDRVDYRSIASAKEKRLALAAVSW